MRWLSRPRRYSPLNRSHGLRRVPDEPVGFALVTSLILHVAIVVSLVRLTDAPIERSRADVSAAIIADLAAFPPANPPTPDHAPGPAPAGKGPAAERAAVVPADGLGSPTLDPRAPKATQPAAPAPASRAVPVARSAIASTTAASPAEDGLTLMSSVSASIATPEPADSMRLDIDTPLDGGWPDLPSVALASPNPDRPAETLTPVPFLRGSVQDTPEPAPPVRLSPQPIRIVAEPLERPAPPALPDAPGVDRAKPVAPDQKKVQARVPRPSSPFGLNRDRALVRLDGPRTLVTDRPTQTVSGTVLGEVPERLVVYVNGIPTDLDPAGRTFKTPVLLRPGANELRAVVTGQAGVEAEDTITVQYAPRSSSNGIALTSPPDGFTVGPDDPPVAVVEGQLDDKTLTTVWIVANDRRIPVTTNAGRFRHTLLLPDPLVHLWAEAPGGDAMHRSGTVTIRTAGARPSSGVLVVQWPAGTNESAVEVSATWRARSERLDSVIQNIRLRAVGEATNGAPSEMFYLQGLKPGVYTVTVRYRGMAPLGDARPTLYLPDRDHLAPRALRPVSLNAAGRTVLAKVLMPQAILWNQEDWFSGTSESVDTVTKFRVPEGVSWVERKADLP